MNNKIKLKKGDEVIVLAGKDKGKIGKLIEAIQDGKFKVAEVIENSNFSI